MKALKYSAIVFSLLAAFGANAQSQATNDDDDETLTNISQTTESEYINLSGLILTYCYLWVDVGAQASSLDLRTGNSMVEVANVQETCNHPNGFTVSISSANSGNLVNHFDATKTLPYNIIYDTQASVKLETPVSLVRTTTRSDDLTNTNRAFKVVWPQSSALVAGTYSDVITLTITSSS